MILEDGKVAYVKIPSFSGSLVDKDSDLLKTFYEDIKDYPYFIIDIRGNGGGSDRYWRENILEPLLVEPISVDAYVLHRNDVFSKTFFDARLGLGNNYFRRSKLDLEKLPNTPPEVLSNAFADPVLFDYTVKPQTPIGFRGEVFLLVDSRVYSAAETFAMVAKTSGFAYLVGTRTGGDGLGFDPIFFTLPNSNLVIRMSGSKGLNPDGSCNEEFQAVPDLFVENIPRSLVGGDIGSDLQLRAVLDLIDEKAEITKTKIVSQGNLFTHLTSKLLKTADYQLAIYQGKRIDEVKVYGAYASDQTKLQKIVNILPGDIFDVKEIRKLQDKLKATLNGQPEK
ncbi:MAG: S41 family peptidase [Firmicutes bacterium]|nr:S41 family peptidase [Bacillota bacterium]MDD4264121.1 S41 family peptidase [Bacillota bacterium]MDD4694116.1 S41 family peptidase [Bacillota bacterium]